RDADGVVERLRLRPGLLADGRVDNEEPFVRLDGLADRLDLLDQVRRERMPSGGVDDEDVHGLQGLDARLRDLQRILCARFAVERGGDLLGQLLELVVGRRPMHVRRDEADGEPLLLEVLRELPGGRRLALAVQADEQDPLFLDRDLAARPEDLDQFLVDNTDDVLAGAHARRRFLVQSPTLELPRDREGELDVHVGLDQGPLDVADDFLDQGLVDVAGPRDLSQGRPQGISELVEDHSWSPKGQSRLSLSLRVAGLVNPWTLSPDCVRIEQGQEPVGPVARMLQGMSRHCLRFVGTTSGDGQTPPRPFRSHVYYTSSQLMP